MQSAKLCQASIQCQRAQPIYRVKQDLRKSLTSDAPIGNAATPAFLSSCETRDIIAGGVLTTEAATEIDYEKLPCLWH